MEEEYETWLKDANDPTYNQESVWNSKPTGKFKPSSYVIANDIFLKNAVYNKWDLSCYQLVLLSDEEIKKGDYYISNRTNKISIYDEKFPLAFCNKIIGSYPELDKFHGYEDISGMPIYENFPTFSVEFLKTWVENPVDEIYVEYRFLRHTREEGHVEELLRSLHDELTCTIPEKGRGIKIINIDNPIEVAAIQYVKSHKHWSPLMRRFYINICIEFAMSDAVKEYYQKSNKT
jgi:hypothetical protein